MKIAEASLLVQKFGAKTQIPLVDRLWQAEARLERSFTRAQRELERLQKSRAEQPRDQPAEAEPANIQHPKSDIPPTYTAAPLPATSQPAALPSIESDSRQAP